ncbi:MAG: hypothetical protein IKM34_06560 [Clostridia bacterium]|nr:hypothetical protein [Clostridia bacterium]
MANYVEDNIEQIIPSVVDKYWCYDLNEEKPSEVSIFTENRYYWRNSTGVLFYRAPLEIDKQSTQTSHAEAFFYCLLKQIFSDTIHRAKVQAIEMDIYIPSINVAIEYDGSYYHKNKLEQDLQKNKQLNELGIYVIRIRDRKCPRLVDRNNAIIDCVYERHDSTIQKILSAIHKHITKKHMVVSQTICKKLKKYSPLNYDLSDENVGKCYKLRSDDPNQYSNERVKNYYLYHKDNIFNQEEWKKLFVLAYSVPQYRGIPTDFTPKKHQLFDGIEDRSVSKRYFNSLEHLQKEDDSYHHAMLCSMKQKHSLHILLAMSPSEIDCFRNKLKTNIESCIEKYTTPS